MVQPYPINAGTRVQMGSDRDTTRKKIAGFLSCIRPCLQPGIVTFPELRTTDEDGFYT